MAIINRLSRLFKADLHAVLDHIEEPELQLKQSVREMEHEISNVNSQIQQHNRQLDQLCDQQESADALLNKTNKEITICFDNKNDELARGLVRRKLETTQYKAQLSESQHKLGKELKALQKNHKEYQNTLESLQLKMNFVVTSKDSHSKFNDHDSVAAFNISEEDIEVALLQERKLANAKAL